MAAQCPEPGAHVKSARPGVKIIVKAAMSSTVFHGEILLPILYGLLVAAAVFGLASCPVTILLNALLINAVKTKQRLQKPQHSVGLFGAYRSDVWTCCTTPLHNRDYFPVKCKVKIFMNLLTLICPLMSRISSSLSLQRHMVLISGERYLSIKHTLTHATAITKARLMVFSAVAWIVALSFFPIVSFDLAVYLFVSQATILLSIVLFQFPVYKEARRHEKLIL